MQMPTYTYEYDFNDAADEMFEAMCWVNALGKDLSLTYRILEVGTNVVSDLPGALNFTLANWSMVGTADLPGVHFYQY